MDTETRRVSELRASESGVVEGVVVKYGDIAVVQGQPERFERGSVVLNAPALNFMHDGRQQIADRVELTDTPDALEFRAQLDSRYAQPIRQLIQGGLLRGASLEFRALQQRLEAGVRVIELARIEGLALVDLPAYPKSEGLQMRRADDTAAFGRIEYRQATGAITGKILFGVAGIVSLARRRKLLIPPDATIDFDDDIFIYDGYDQSRPIASSQAGSLSVRRTADALAFSTVGRRLAKTRVTRDVLEKIRAGLLKGVVPGLGVRASDTHTDKDGFTVEVVTDGIWCHGNLVARTGEGYSGQLASRPRRRRRGVL